MSVQHECRAFARQRTAKDGKVILTKSTLLDCVVRDLSSGGARLEFAGPTALPSEFKLRISVEATAKPVELAWQRGLRAGVRFEGLPLS